MNKIEFQQQVPNSFKDIPSSFFESINIYKQLIQEHNKITNLTSLDDENKIYGELFYDSLIPYKNIDFKNFFSILDIGSGVGVPGILLKILFPNIKLTIIESNNKKINFLKIVVDKLSLKDVILLNKRAEDIKQDQYEKFDIVTSRAVAPLKVIMELSTPYCKTNGLIIEPKSKNYLNEQKEFTKFSSRLNVELLNIESFISYTNHEHHVFVYKKLKPTNRIFPRKWSVIMRNKNE